MILGVSYKDDQGKYYHTQDIIHQAGKPFSKQGHKPLTSMVEKMSKSKLNVINPDDVVNEYGADALRLYEMFMGPLEATKPWQSEGVKGVYNFLQRVWQLSVDPTTGKQSASLDDHLNMDAHPKLYQRLNQLIEKVTYDIEHLKFNTSIAKMMEFTNECKQQSVLSTELWKTFITLLSPFAPHICEEIWQIMGNKKQLAYQAWPIADPNAVAEEEAKTLFLEDPKIIKVLADRHIKKLIVVKQKLINAVV